MNLQRIFYSLLIIFLFAGTALADENKHVDFTAKPSKLKVDKGDNLKIKLTMEFDEHWHSYSMKEQVNELGIGPTPLDIVPDTNYFEFNSDDILAPKPKTKYDEGFEMDVETYAGKVDFIIPVKAKQKINFKKDTPKVEAYIQQCDTSSCLPPLSFFVAVEHEIYAAGDEPMSEFEKKQQEGFFSFLWFSMTMGAFALLMPCVFPMIPITVSFFTKRTEQAKGKGLRDAIVYALGIIITFTLLGFLFSLIFGASGIQDFAKNPWVYLAISAIFMVFALSLFGAFELQVPPKLLNKLNAKSQQGSGIFSVILMGLTFSLASFSCTGPLVAAALISAAGGQWFYPIISMAGFSAVLAAPFFLLALFPSWMSSMPKSGGWLNNIKVVLGFFVVIATLYFVNNALLQWDVGMPRGLFLGIWVASFFLMTLYILGVFRTNHDSPIESIGTSRIVLALIFGTITFYLFSGMFGGRLGFLETYIPQQERTMAAGKTTDQPEETWETNYKKGLQIAKEENKNVFIDFTGKTCTNCKKMENTMFPKASVSNLMDKMVKVKLITDVRKEPYISNRNLQKEKFNSIAIPLYAIVTPSEEIIATASYTNSEKKFIEFLKKGVKNNKLAEKNM